MLAFAKACRGQELTDEESLVLTFLFAELAARGERLYLSGRILGEQNPWRDLTRTNFGTIFSVPAGHGYWDYWREAYFDEYRDYVDELKQSSQRNCIDMINAISKPTSSEAVAQSN